LFEEKTSTLARKTGIQKETLKQIIEKAKISRVTANSL
jgi:hypothetical protein